jgi:hypothetical protein
MMLVFVATTIVSVVVTVAVIVAGERQEDLACIKKRFLAKPTYQAGKGAWIFAQRNQGASSAQEELSVARRGVHVCEKAEAKIANIEQKSRCYLYSNRN